MPHRIFSMYSDELEIVNPTGTHRKVHKIIVFYWTLLNIPSAYRHKLHVVFSSLQQTNQDTSRSLVMVLCYKTSAAVSVSYMRVYHC